MPKSRRFHKFLSEAVLLLYRGARVAQWWEHSPPTNVPQVRILALTPYVGWVCCWFSPLLREDFLRVLWFSPLLKNQHFQFPIPSGTHGHVSTSSYELLRAPWINKLQFTNIQITNLQYSLKQIRLFTSNFSGWIHNSTFHTQHLFGNQKINSSVFNCIHT